MGVDLTFESAGHIAHHHHGHHHAGHIHHHRRGGGGFSSAPMRTRHHRSRQVTTDPTVTALLNGQVIGLPDGRQKYMLPFAQTAPVKLCCSWLVVCAKLKNHQGCCSPVPVGEFRSSAALPAAQAQLTAEEHAHMCQQLNAVLVGNPQPCKGWLCLFPLFCIGCCIYGAKNNSSVRGRHAGLLQVARDVTEEMHRKVNNEIIFVFCVCFITSC